MNRPLVRQFLATFTACLSMIGWGCNIGWTAIFSGSQLSSNETMFSAGMELNHEQISWMGGSFSIGGLLGALMAGLLCEKLGRKIVLHILSALSVISWLVISGAWNMYSIVCARLLLGFISSASSSASALYVAEIAQANIRGALGNCLSFSVALGITFVMFLGALLHWRIVSMVCAMPQITAMLLWFLVPESPYFLAVRKRDECADKSVRWLMVEESLIQETRRDISKFLTSQVVEDGEEDEQSTKDDPKCALKLLLMSAIMAFSRLCGVTQYSYYMVDIMENTAGSDVSASWAAAGVSIFEILGSILAIFLCDRVGRRKLLISSALGMCLANSALYVHQIIHIQRTWVAPICALSLFYMSFTLGFAGLPFVILGEIFPPSRYKSVAVSLSVSFIWVLNFVNTKCYYDVLSLVDYHGLFLLNGLCCLMAFIVVFLALPETKNKSLSQVQEAFNQAAWK